MRIDDFQCEDCQQTFEALLETGEAVECPKCRSLVVRKLFSAPRVAKALVVSEEKRKQKKWDRRNYLGNKLYDGPSRGRIEFK